MSQAAPLSTVESAVLDCAYALALASSGPLDSPQAKELAAVAAEMLIRAAYQLPRDSFESAKLTTGEFNEP